MTRQPFLARDRVIARMLLQHRADALGVALDPETIEERITKLLETVTEAQWRFALSLKSKESDQ